MVWFGNYKDEKVGNVSYNTGFSLGGGGVYTAWVPVLVCVRCVGASRGGFVQPWMAVWAYR